MSNPTLIKNFLAGGAIGAGLIVKFSADATVVVAAAATDLLVGVLHQPGGVASGGRCDVALAGIVNVVAGGSISRGALVTADAAGKAVAVTRHTHTENTAGTYTQNDPTGVATGGRAIGMAMLEAASGDLVPVLIAPSHT